MLNKIQSVLKDPSFQRKAAQTAGGVASVILSFAASQLIGHVIEVGVDKIMDKVQGVTPATIIE